MMRPEGTANADGAESAIRPGLKLTMRGAALLVDAAVTAAQSVGQPQCIAVVDDGCNLVAFLRMDGARVLSIDSSIRKAMTAASSRLPSGSVNVDVEMQLALATGGKFTPLRGGLPIVVDGQTVGGIGVGSGTAEQDVAVAQAAVHAFERLAASIVE